MAGSCCSVSTARLRMPHVPPPAAEWRFGRLNPERGQQPRSADIGTAGAAERAAHRAAAGNPADAGGLRELHRSAHGYLESCQDTRQRSARLTALSVLLNRVAVEAESRSIT